MKLQFKQQDFQIQAVGAVVDVFAGQTPKTNRFTLERSRELVRKARDIAAGAVQSQLELDVFEDIGYRNAPIQIDDEHLLENIRAVQRRNDLIESRQIEHPRGSTLRYNLTIEMETGTGKTYTYIRTMYELHRHYGWSKFIVVVPGIAIREGVYKSFQITCDHFQELYGYRISPFIYHSGRPQDIENFASDSRISVMIINMQAFSARGADALRIHQELDQFGTRRPIDIIAQTNPILIIDEPQSVAGKVTLDSMQKFCPLFTLRYSATHRAEYNKIYRLDAVDAYNRQLVKKIQVKGISLKGSTGTTGYLYPEQIVISSGKPPYVLIEYEKRSGDGVKKVRGRLERGANLFELSGGIPAYQHHTVTEIDAYRNMITVNGRDIYAGDIQGAVDEGTFRRIQIREAIASHLQKERQLFERGIKVLSLFFIDSVEKYRVYDESGEAAAGEYARIFEEEYSNLRNDCLELFQSESDDCQPGTDAGKRTKYSDYLWRDDASRVHEGYFSVDRKGKMTDPAVKGKSEDSDDISAYELIMKDKERLLSFEEPVRFIFSHSALKEGWDNPNVFQICALKNPEAGSSTRRRQEVGRGMRLCVDARGIRQDFELLGEQVHEINKLTVIASESYEAFARGLQDEIAVTLQSRPQRANTEFFIGKLVMDETGVQRRLTKDDARKLQVKLIVNQVIDEDYKITDTGREQIERNSIEVPLHLEPYRESIAELLRSIYSGEPPKPEDERQTITLNTNGNFRKREFQELWDRISLKTVYEVKIDVEKLFVESRNRINARLNVSEQHYEIRTGEMKSGTVEEMRAGDLIRESERENLTVKADLPARTAYDMIGEIEARTHLTRNTIVRILKSIHVEKFIMMRRNPEEFIAKCSKLINEAKASLIFDGIVYHKTEERYDAKTVFTNDKLVLRNSEMLKKHVYDYLTTDSKIESEFAQALENSVEVVVYAKLPKSFHITTPVANYSPDWAIVFDKDRVRHIYFVAETKGSESDMDLREIEKLKIHCAEKHFDAIGGGTVKFSKIKTYNGLLELIQ